jgi:hypothetical protein
MVAMLADKIAGIDPRAGLLKKAPDLADYMIGRGLSPRESAVMATIKRNRRRMTTAPITIRTLTFSRSRSSDGRYSTP